MKAKMERYRFCRNYEFLYENLNEGLIKSYDIRNVKKYLENEYHFTCIDSIISLDYNPYNNVSNKIYKDAFVEIYLKNDYKSIFSYIKVANTCYNLFGWLTSYINVRVKIKEGYKDHYFSKGIDNTQFFENDTEVRKFLLSTPIQNIISVSLIIEEKFPIRKYNYGEDTIFYHITNIRNKDKILKNEIVPKSNYNYPDRIYLTDSLDDIRFIKNERFSNNDYIIFKMKLVHNQQIYIDSRMGDCSGFTYDNIYPNEIQGYLTKINES